MMGEIRVEISDADELTPEDWAGLWSDLVSGGCDCSLTSKSVEADGAKGPEIVYLLVVGAMVVARFVDALTRFYAARRRGSIELTYQTKTTSKAIVIVDRPAAEARQLIEEFAKQATADAP